ncbi:hypothetical protein ACYSNR_14355 [Enterococcus sp. LJL128]
MYIEKLASNLNQQTETQNVEIAKLLVQNQDDKGIFEIVQGLKQKKAIANDCIKVLYEVGEQNPSLITAYVSELLDCLASKNNRLVWGAMTALATIAEEKAEAIHQQIDKVLYAYENGSVITVDNSISVFAKLCKVNKEYEKELFPLLLTHLSTCRPKEVAQHSERVALCISSHNKHLFIDVLEKRKPELTTAQKKRIEKLLKKITVIN